MFSPVLVPGCIFPMIPPLTIPVELTKICCLVFVSRGLSPAVCFHIFTQYFLLALRSMAGLHCGLLLYVLPCLAQLTDQLGESGYCGTISKKCGTHAKILCNATSNLTYATVAGPYNTNTSKNNSCQNFVPPTSQDGRLQLTWSGITAKLLINRVQHSDAGTYCFYLKPKDSSGASYQADLQIQESSEVLNISGDPMAKKIVCQAAVGCPVATIQWADGTGTNWTQSATSEEKNGVLTSTLLLQSSVMEKGYSCTVTYWYPDKTENQTRHIYIGQNALTSEDPKHPMYILVAVPILICALFTPWIYYRRRYVHQANDVPGQRSPSEPLVPNDIEMAAGAQST